MYNRPLRHSHQFANFFWVGGGGAAAVHRPSETDNPSSNCPSKLTDKQTPDNNRRIVPDHSKLKPFHFQIKTYYLSDANYQTDNPSISAKTAISVIAGFQCHAVDQNKNQNRSIDKVQNLGNERRYIYKDPRQDADQRNISYTRYPKKCFTQTYRDL